MKNKEIRITPKLALEKFAPFTTLLQSYVTENGDLVLIVEDNDKITS